MMFPMLRLLSFALLLRQYLLFFGQSIQTAYGWLNAVIVIVVWLNRADVFRSESTSALFYCYPGSCEASLGPNWCGRP